MRRSTLAIPGLIATLSACVTQPPHPDQEGGLVRAAEQPMHDLTIMRDDISPVLKEAQAAPYDTRHANSCSEIEGEVARLDAALGPDLKPGAKPGRGLSFSHLAAGAVTGFVHLPYRSVVRQLSGAEKRDRELHAAQEAGMVRRGFLKGREGEMNCARAIPASTAGVPAEAHAAQHPAAAAPAPGRSGPHAGSKAKRPDPHHPHAKPCA